MQTSISEEQEPITRLGSTKQEEQRSGTLLDKMEDNDHIELDNITDLDVSFTVRPAVFEA